MLERRLWSNFALAFFFLITCISLWQMSTIGPYPLIPAAETSQVNSIPVYTLNTINFTYTYPLQQLPFSDYSQLMNLFDFRFEILNPCTYSPVLLVLVHSSPENFMRRKTIRQTWGRNTNKLKVVFMLGYVLDAELQRRLEQEYRKHRDFVQGSFLDAYKNLTYKHVMSFKYAIYHCPQARYVLKTDDDVFVNIPVMMDFLTKELSLYGARNLLFCTPLANSIVKRSYRSKWRVSFYEYSERYYPPYCLGWAVMYSPDILFMLYQDIQKTRYFWIDDVLITGILAQKKNIKHTSVSWMVLSLSNLNRMMYEKGPYNCSKPFLYGPPELTQEMIFFLWDLVKNCSSNKTLPLDYR